MTAIIGVLCKDGVVIGSDSSTTFTAGAVRTIEQPTEKIHVIGGSVIVAGTGSVGLNQRFCNVVNKIWNTKEFKGLPMDVCKRICREALQDFQYTGAKIDYGALVAFPIDHKPYLCEFETGTLQPELKTEKLWYSSVGSTQYITDPFLGFMREVFWKEGCPNVQNAAFVVTWVLQHAISLNTGGVNGPSCVAVLEKDKKWNSEARIITKEELAQHEQFIQEAISHLRDFRKKLQPDALGNVPDVPKPK